MIAPEIEAACRSDMRIGDTVRVRHQEDAQGNLCTPVTKDAACAVTRTDKGWVWYCHRCYENGFKSAEMSSPSDIKAMIAARAAKKIESVAKASLPSDARPLGEEAVPEEGIPIDAYRWLWKYGLTEVDMQEFEMYWSDLYQRVIIPVRNQSNRLVGWVGREVRCKDKEQRKKRGLMKYLMKKEASQKRIYYRINGSTNTVVIVEDIISAIKIHKAVGCTTIALLTTSMDTSLIRTLRGKKVYVWLDADALAKTMKIISKLSQLGIATSYCHTPEDPKAYDAEMIKEYLKWERRINYDRQT